MVFKRLDSFLVLNVALIIIMGLVFLTSSSSYESLKQSNDSLYFLKHQIIFGFLIGLIAFAATLIFPYYQYKKISFALLLVGLGTLLLVFTPLGHQAGGAARWIS